MSLERELSADPGDEDVEVGDTECLPRHSFPNIPHPHCSNGAGVKTHDCAPPIENDIEANRNTIPMRVMDPNT